MFVFNEYFRVAKSEYAYQGFDLNNIDYAELSDRVKNMYAKDDLLEALKRMQEVLNAEYDGDAHFEYEYEFCLFNLVYGGMQVLFNGVK